MNELPSDEKLATADLDNPPRPAADVPVPAISEAATSSPSDRVLNTRNPQPIAVVSQPAKPGPLSPRDEFERFRSRWDKVQTSFVDGPRTAVEQADNLVFNVFKHIAEQFVTEREQLEKQWNRTENVNTEDLRQALKRYRAFFDRLVAFGSGERTGEETAKARSEYTRRDVA